MTRNSLLKLLLIPVIMLLVSGARPQKVPTENALITGIDHIPIVVRNLDSAAAIYKQLGFALKPGRLHANGIRNQHVKFKNGTELELITAPQALDTLSTEYYNSLKEGEGPVYFGLYSTNIPGIAQQLDGYTNYQNRGFITFPASNTFHNLFFGGRQIAATDKPEHFAHRNSATSLVAVWLATDHITQFLDLFKRLGIATSQQRIYSPLSTQYASIAKLKEGEVILLPASNQLTRNHPVIGATVKIENIEALKTTLKQAGIKILAVIKGAGNTQSLFLPPEITHGIWLEFRQF